MSKRQITIFAGYDPQKQQADDEDRANVRSMVGQLADLGIRPDVINCEINPRATGLAKVAHEAFSKAARALGDTKMPEYGTAPEARHDVALTVTTLTMPDTSLADLFYKVSPAPGVKPSTEPVQAWVERSKAHDWDSFYRNTVELDHVIRPGAPKI